MNNKTISFDFDGTIDDHFDGVANPYIEKIRHYVLHFIKLGYDVNIITRRYGPHLSFFGQGSEHEKVWRVAATLGISRDKIFFTNREWKYATIAKINAFMHIDDDDREIYWIERHLPQVVPIYLGESGWENKIICTVEGHDNFKIWFNNKKSAFYKFIKNVRHSKDRNK